ncbi:E3 ubiquitin-protein like [Actinidia chinensis var. chinensis]|uniref:E3 ubiquitin-protein like n=1 Tax=Actinidia chinensis var. chinensis TaxID=1590841 RepID=A0A2R6PPV6_ACTCC|nr:E3 ubiquitin-protein like [Actinidia chinensis var. chinensis]
MSAVENPSPDLESGRRQRQRRRQRRRRRRPESGETTTGGSLCFSDSDRDHGETPPCSTAGTSFSEIEGVVGPHRLRESSANDFASYDVDLERGDLEVKVRLGKEERDCRICHLKLVGRGGGGDEEAGVAIELGCACKGDLANAHKQCAETWFKIRGNTTCEICGATALNVVGEQTNEGNGATASISEALAGPATVAENQGFWHGRRVMNTLLTCLVFAFVVSWLFHFHLLS